MDTSIPKNSDAMDTGGLQSTPEPASARIVHEPDSKGHPGSGAGGEAGGEAGPIPAALMGPTSPTGAAPGIVPTGLDNGIEIDGGWNDSDSTFSDNGSSYLTSLSSGVTDYQFENGRRYHRYKEGRYNLPNDEDEMEREDMKHHMCTVLLEGRLHLAPIARNPQKILDIGTGTGIWAIEMADKHPSAEVIGTDLSPIQPPWVPPNCVFEVDDVEADWLYQPNSIDYIHVRHMFVALLDWPKMIRQSFRTLKPGGWIECMEMDPYPFSYDNSLPAQSKQLELYNVMKQASSKRKLDIEIGSKLKGYMEEAGFEKVTEEVFDLPLGAWPKDKRLKEVGAFHYVQLRGGFQAIVMALFTRVLGWSTQQVEVFLASIRKELDDKSIHSCWKIYISYGRKPGGNS